MRQISDRIVCRGGTNFVSVRMMVGLLDSKAREYFAVYGSLNADRKEICKAFKVKRCEWYPPSGGPGLEGRSQTLYITIR